MDSQRISKLAGSESSGIDVVADLKFAAVMNLSKCRPVLKFITAGTICLIKARKKTLR